MKTFVATPFIAALLTLATVPLHSTTRTAAVSTGWFGVWTLDRSQSHFVGPSITISRVPAGYHFDFGAVSFDVGDDGRDFPTVPTRTTSIKPVGEREWLRVHKVNGKEVDHGTLTLTPDDRTMLIHTIATDGDGKTHTSDEAEIRMGAGAGLAGTWRSTTAGVNVSDPIVLTDAGGGKIRWEFPNDGQYYVIAPNGDPAGYEGSRAVPGVTVTLQTTAAHEMRWTEAINGKAYTQGLDVLSDDGRVLRETSWPVARPGDRQEAVYERRQNPVRK